MRLGPVTAAALAALALAGCGGPAAPAPEQGPTIAFRDDFSGPAGTPPDPTVWTSEIGNAEVDGWGNQELQYYTDGADNLSLDGDGHLAITARAAPVGADVPCWDGDPCPWTSGRITSSGAVVLATGHAEARMKVPSGTGLWPAFWMLGGPPEQWPEGGEIDVMEVVGRAPTTVNGTVHGPGYSDADGITGSVDVGTDLSDGFHTYAVDKGPESVTWSVDGVPYLEVTPDDLPDGAPWVFDRPFHLLLNLAVGGSMPGSPDGSTGFPSTLLVDHVAVSGVGASTPAGGG